MVEDRQNKSSGWNQKLVSEAALRQAEQEMFASASLARKITQVVIFLCGFCCGVGTILLLVK